MPQDQTDLQAKLIVWIFAMRFLMDFMSGVSYFINQAISEKQYGHLKEFDFEAAADPADLDRRDAVHLDVVLHELAAVGRSLTVDGQPNGRNCGGNWPRLSVAARLAAVLIPEFTKVFTSSHSKHVHEIVTASREGGASLTILSGLVAGYFSAFWMGLLIAGLMGGAFFVSPLGLDTLMQVSLAPWRAAGGRGLDFCLRPRGLRLLVHGPGHDRRR